MKKKYQGNNATTQANGQANVQHSGPAFVQVSVSGPEIEMQIQWQDGETLLQALLRADCPIFHSCGGGASCGTCKIEVAPEVGALIAKNELELDFATHRKFSDRERLSCQMEFPKNGNLKSISIRVCYVESKT